METRDQAAESAGLSVAQLRERCDGVERDILFRKLATADALEVMRPGGAENRDESAAGWLVYLLHLTRVHARGGSAPVPGGESAATERELELAISASLRNAPVYVRFDDGRVRAVHPKSYDTLEFLDQLDILLRVNAGHLVQHAMLERLADVRVYVDASELRSRAVLVWLWVLTHPGAGLPFDKTAANPTPPKWTLVATPEDLMRVAQAHIQVHAQRNRIMSAAFPPDPATTTSRLPLAGFIGAMAQETGNQPSELMNRWTLGEVLAQSIVSARAAKEAEQNATRKTER